jgi:hypothetical protein
MHTSWRRTFALLMAITLVALITGCGSGGGKRESNLQGTVKFIGARFEVTNEGDAPWEDVAMKVIARRETYAYNKELAGREGPIRIEPGEAQEFKMGAFAARDGTQFGGLRSAGGTTREVDEFIIECTVNGQPGYWAGEPEVVRE